MNRNAKPLADWARPRVIAAETRKLERLARHLTHDPADAADLAQDTWVTALSRGAPESGLGGWLAVVGRNLFRRRRRDELRRARLLAESGLAPDAAPPAPETLARLELVRALTELVQALEEPYRSTVILRYFEERSAAAIASAQRIPAGTVRWRLKVGLDRLRAGMDQRHGGDRRRWALLAASFGDRSAGAAGPVTAIGALAALVVTIGAVVLGAGRLSVPGAADIAAPAAPALAPAPRRDPPRFAAAAPVFELGLSGQVRDGGGRPLPGAAVSLFPTRETTLDTDPAQRRALVRHTRSDGAGRYTFTNLLPGHFTATATHPDWAASAAPIALAAGRTHALDLALAPAAGSASLRGQVSDRGGGALAGARVTAIGRAGVMLAPTRFAALADADGSYALRVPAGSWYVEVAADGYAGVSADVVLAASGAHTQDFSLAPTTRVEGRVRDASGAPAVGAVVRLEPVAAGPGTREQVAEADGRFAFDSVEPNRYRLLAQHDSGATVTALDTVPGATAPLSLVLAPAAHAGGRVLDAHGQPLAGAQVELVSSATNLRALRRTQAGPDGRWRIGGILPGSYFLSGEAPGHAPVRVPLLVADAPVERDLALAPAVTVSGIVVDRAGAAVPEAGVEAYVVKGAGRDRVVMAFRNTRTDRDGRFRLADLGVGVLLIQAEAGAHGRGGVRAGEVAPGEQREVTIRLLPRR